MSLLADIAHIVDMHICAYLRQMVCAKSQVQAVGRRAKDVAIMFMVVGLGNPGKKYEGTRHNIGHMVIDELAERFHVKLSKDSRSQTMAACAHLVSSGRSEQIILATSLSYMNTSGGPVSALLNYYRADTERLIVIHDDLDLPFGLLRLKRSGSEGGHNGLKSISQSLGTRSYIRMRVGIGRPPGSQDPAAYVLSRFSSQNRAELPFIIDTAADSVIDVIENGLESATMRLHTAQKAAGK